MTQGKTCSKCGTYYEDVEGNFNKNKKTPDGYQYICKICAKNKNKQWHDAHPNYSIEKSKEWYENNPEHRKEYSKSYHIKNREHLLQKNRDWREHNHDYVLEKSREYRLENPNKKKEWYMKNPEYHKEHYQKNKPKYQDQFYKKRYGIGLDQKNKKIEYQGGLCAICGCDLYSLESKRVHIDHVHGTKIIRDILCHDCNIGIGVFHENITTLNNAIQYLKKWNQENE